MRSSRFDSIIHLNIIRLKMSIDIVIFNLIIKCRELGDFMKMGGKKSVTVDISGNMISNGISKTESIMSGSASS